MASGQLEIVCSQSGALTPQTSGEPSDWALLDRFVKSRDENAFAAIVARHAGMALGICRRVLRNSHDAEDACQAAFLVLARKAASVRKRESLASWLHGVAYHVAMNLRRDLNRRAARRTSPQEFDEADTLADLARSEEQAMIDEELARLPERYRSALVLCYLEGRTRDEAASELGWTVGKLRRRLERGRELLHRRLTRRGLALSTALFAVALTESSASAAAPAAVVAATIKAVAVSVAGRAAATAGASARAAALADGMIKALVTAKAKFAAGVVAVVLAGAAVVPVARHLMTSGAGLQATDWPGWRGPTGMGSAASNDVPQSWGGSDNRNIRWTVRIDRMGPFQSYSSPIVCGDRLFLTAATPVPDGKPGSATGPVEHWVACYRTTDGKQLWQTQIAPGPWLTTDHFCGYAVPTPVTDGKYVYAWFGSAVMTALDFEGRVVWRRERPGPYHFGGSQAFCASPILFEDTILQLCDQNDGASFLMAVDKRTGEIRWEKKRPDVASNVSTPILIQAGGRWQLVVSSTKGLEGLDPQCGEPIWWCKCPGHPATPVYGSGLVVTASGAAVDPTGRGDVTQTHIKWMVTAMAGGPSSPIIVGDYVYRVDNEGVLQCRKLVSGELVYKERLPGLGPQYEVSPFATPDGRIYFVSWGQKSYVIQAGPAFKLLAVNEPLKPDSMDCYTSPAVSGGRIFLKAGHLCCISADGPATH